MIITFNSKSICIVVFYIMDITVQVQKWMDKSKPKEPTFVLMYLDKLRG